MFPPRRAPCAPSHSQAWHTPGGLVETGSGSPHQSEPDILLTFPGCSAPTLFAFAYGPVQRHSVLPPFVRATARRLRRRETAGQDYQRVRGAAAPLLA